MHQKKSIFLLIHYNNLKSEISKSTTSQGKQIFKSINCGNCIVCQINLTPICDFCQICQNKFNLTIEQNQNKLSIVTQTNIKYNFNEINSEVILLGEKDLFVKKIHDENIQKNKVLPLSILKNEEEYLYFLELMDDKFRSFQIRFENMIVKVRPSTKPKLFFEEKQKSLIYPLCNQYLKVPLELSSQDIYSVRIGFFTKSLKINIIIFIKCTNKQVLKTSRVTLKVGSLLILSLMSNISTTMFTSMFYFKDILDAPHMVRKKLSPKVTFYLSLLAPFECKDGINVGSELNSYQFYKSMKEFFIPSERNETYNILTLDYSTHKNSEYAKTLASCRGVLLISDLVVLILSLGLILVLILLWFLDCLFLKNVLNLLKTFKIGIKFLYFLVMLVYFDNWIYLLNELRIIKFHLFGLSDIFYVVVRSAYVIIPMIFIYFEEKKQKEKFDNKIKNRSFFPKNKSDMPPSTFLNVLKNLLILFLVIFFNERPELWILFTSKNPNTLHILPIFFCKIKKEEKLAYFLSRKFLLIFFVLFH